MVVVFGLYQLERLMVVVQTVPTSGVDWGGLRTVPTSGVDGGGLRTVPTGVKVALSFAEEARAASTCDVTKVRCLSGW